jgi:hypothetical protein
LRQAGRLALAASLATLPGPAQAQGNAAPSLGCPLIRAMANVDGGNFRSIRLSMRPPFLAVGPAGMATAGPAADCSAELATDQAYFGCHWDGPNGVDAAVFDAVVSEVSRCLRVRRPTPTGPERNEQIRVIRRSVIDVRAHRGTTGVVVRLLGAPGQQPGGRQWVSLEFTYMVMGPSRVD